MHHRETVVPEDHIHFTTLYRHTPVGSWQCPAVTVGSGSMSDATNHCPLPGCEHSDNSLRISWSQKDHWDEIYKHKSSTETHVAGMYVHVLQWHKMWAKQYTIFHQFPSVRTFICASVMAKTVQRKLQHFHPGPAGLADSFARFQSTSDLRAGWSRPLEIRLITGTVKPVRGRSPNKYQL